MKIEIDPDTANDALNALEAAAVEAVDTPGEHLAAESVARMRTAICHATHEKPARFDYVYRVARDLGVSEAWLRGEAEAGRIPSLKISRTGGLRLDRAQTSAALRTMAANRVQPEPSQ